MKIVIDDNIEIDDNNRQLNIRLFPKIIDSPNYICFTGTGAKILKIMVDRVIEQNE